ncbi:MAG: HDOD domain-containing protein [Syntrophobacteraceae bacterium]|jgi:HD-like signal output (HDOD) protein|nr:HDOD domain-containing protein [Syntrophobacteraceae bacterium]
MSDDPRSLIDLIKEHLATTKTQLWVNPGIALEIQQLLQNPGFSIEQVAGLILRDQTLSGQILRVANSTFFSGLKKVGTIRDAIVRMGARQILNCVMVVTQKNLYQSSNDEISRQLAVLWQHALGCAVGTRWLTERIGYRELSQEGFLAGLLHDIGKLFLLNVLDHLHREGKLHTDLSGALIREILASLHAEYGSRLLTQWNLPETYIQVARDHHSETLDSANTLLLALRIANQTCRKIGLGIDQDPSLVLAVTPEVHALGVKEITLAELEIVIEDAAVAAV